MAVYVIINGPNLNLLGKRQVEIYGTLSFDEWLPQLQNRFSEHELIYRQSNHEGDLIDWLHEFGFTVEGIILNAGGYTHTSIALADAVASIKSPVVEVHISNILERESFRHHSYLSACCVRTIMGKGLEGYAEALTFLSM
ncbi:MAG: type II 3-dehydroquinate dehydratase [Saprospiraceae bacterium]|nr:type II 3-dehydroquinate dehydratase [Saprospiraceae bacterium]